MSDRLMVLLVEDNADDELLALRALRRLPIPLTVIVARDGASAVEMIESLKTPPNLVVSDFKLPMCDGASVIASVRGNTATRETAAIVFSSSDQHSDISACRDAGADSYVCKPVGFQEYMDVLGEAVTYWLDGAGRRDRRAPHCEFRAKHAALSR